MELRKLVAHANLVSDEDFDFVQVIEFINDAIDKINIECGAKFPTIDSEFDTPEDEYTAIPDTWQRMLLVPFTAGRIKENDSSQFEYTDWYAQFDLNLDKFKSKYDIPEKYLETNLKTGRYEDNLLNNPYSPTRGW